MIADLYDFDGTVFNGESGSEFMLFCYKRHPKLFLNVPRQAWCFFKRFVLKKGTFDDFKQEAYCWLKSIDADKEAELFWDKNAHRMNEWFKPEESDVPVVICSASPLFQVKPICERLGVHLIIATDMDKKTGRLNFINCKGENKLKYIEKYAPEYEFRDVYTDNIQSDSAILNLATRNRYRVTKGKIEKI